MKHCVNLTLIRKSRLIQLMDLKIFHLRHVIKVVWRVTIHGRVIYFLVEVEDLKIALWVLLFCFCFCFFICFGLWICLLLKIQSTFNNTAVSVTVWMSFCFSFFLKTLLWPLSYLSHFEKKSHLVRKILCPIHTSSIYSIKYTITIPAFSKSSFWLYIHSIYQK